MASASMVAAAAISDYACTLILAKEEARIHRDRHKLIPPPWVIASEDWLLTLLLLLKVSPSS